jgi:hypothetical protein
MNIAVVDAGGNLLCFERMEKAWLGSIDIAMNKAWTARAFDIETKALSELSQPDDQFFGIHTSNTGRVMIFYHRRASQTRRRGRRGDWRQRRNGKANQAVAEAGANVFSEMGS